jgi:hypothetical protein
MAPNQTWLCRLTAVSGLSALAGPGCHVVVRTETMRPTAIEHVVHPEGAIAHRAELVWTDAGGLRFVEPLECPTEEILRQHATIELATRPNLATFTVGVIAAAAGGILLTTGLFSDRPGASPYTYLGLAGAGVGLPFAIGPWLGDHIEVREGGEPAAERRPGPSQPCGERPVPARSATLEVGGLEIRGAVDRDGRFAISPYRWLDAYGAASAPAQDITARVDGDAGPRTIATVLDARGLASHAADFLAHADFDAAIQPLKLVPGIAAAPLRAGLVTGDDGPALRVVLALRNDGPGEASGLRGQITAPGAPAIDGRMIYVGRLARGAAVTRELMIPLAPGAAAALRGQVIDLSIELRDAHGTAPPTPVRFHGAISGDGPR